MHEKQVNPGSAEGFDPHASELHSLIAASTTTVVRDAAGRAVGQHATILPGSLAERDALLAIDAERWADE